MITIKKIIKPAYLSFINIKKIIFWHIQARRLLSENKTANLNSLNLIGKFEKVLIIAPHADDELFGCHNFMRKQKNVLIYLFSMTGNRTDKNNKVNRENEFMNYCRNYGFKYKIANSDEMNDLNMVLKDFKPNAIAITPVVDYHNEHRKANFILKDVLESIEFKPDIIWYQITTPVPFCISNYYVSASIDEQKEKYTAFSSFYPSQRLMPVRIYILREKIQAYLLMCGHSTENYYVMTTDKFIKYMEIARTIEFTELEPFINDLYIIEHMSLEIYNILFNKLKEEVI